MIGAARRRAETHSSSGQLHEGPDRSTFLGLPPHYGGLFLSANNAPVAATAEERSMVHAQRGFMNCFFWCGQPEAAYSDDDLEDSDDLASGVPDYLFGRRLGESHQGEVRYAIRRADGESVAVKCVKRHRHSAKEEENALEEATVLSRLSHASIVRLLSFESLPSYHYLVLELLDGGEIVDAVAELATYTENDARQIAVAILSALRHAHDDGVCVHRNLRPEHLLIARDPSMASLPAIGRRVKVAGWGRSRRLPPGGLVPGEPCFVNRAFSAPEMILEEPHGPAADMFAVGAILYTLLSGSPPRTTTMASAISPKAPNTSGPAWGCVSDEAKALVQALMTPEGPAARLTAGEALEHGWIKAGKGVLRARSLDAVLKGARVLCWRGALQSKSRAREMGGGSAQGGILRAVSMF